MFIDTHAHLDDGQFPDVDAVIAASHVAGVHRIINIGYGPRRWQSTIALGRRHPSVGFCLGLHPSEADHFGPDVVDALSELVRNERPVGIGEAGIDLFREGPELRQQQAAFGVQIDLAIEHDLPLVIHQRAAENEVYDQLAGADRRLRIVLHSFDASHRMLDLAVDRGWYIGVGGLMTRQAASDVREVLRLAPLSQLILETDAPYLVPAGIKDRRNSPVNIPVIARRLAVLLATSVEEIAAQTTANALRAFPRLATIEARTSGAYAS
jgi:TatD DNase family protein